MTTTISHQNEEELHRKCAAILETVGWCCVPPNGRQALERPGELCKRMGVTPKHLSRAMHHQDCPPFYKETGPTGRVLKLYADSRFITFVLRHKDRRGGSKTANQTKSASGTFHKPNQERP